MTNPIAQHEKLKQEQKRIAQELKYLEQEERYQQALAFKKDIDDVLEKHGKTEADLLAFFAQPSAKKANKSSPHQPKKTLPLKRYINPHTREEVKAKSLKSPELKEWKDKYGNEEVKMWVVEISDEEAAKDSPDEPSKGQEATAT